MPAGTDGDWRFSDAAVAGLCARSPEDQRDGLRIRTPMPSRAGGGWATERAMLLAVGWPVVLTVVSAVPSVRRFQALSA